MWQRLEAVLARNINLHHHFPVNNVFGSIPCIQASWFSMLSRSVTVRILNMCNWASLHLKILDLRKQSKSVEHNFCSTRNVQIVQDHALVHHLPSLQLKQLAEIFEVLTLPALGDLSSTSGSSSIGKQPVAGQAL